MYSWLASDGSVVSCGGGVQVRARASDAAGRAWATLPRDATSSASSTAVVAALCVLRPSLQAVLGWGSVRPWSAWLARHGLQCGMHSGAHGAPHWRACLGARSIV